MELSFASENSAEASFLVQELELALHQQGIPAAAMSLRASSPENMDVGSILWVSIEALNQLLGPIGSIATLASCVHQIMTKYNRDAVIKNEEEKLKIPVSGTTLPRIQDALTPPARPRTKPKYGA